MSTFHHLYLHAFGALDLQNSLKSFVLVQPFGKTTIKCRYSRVSAKTVIRIKTVHKNPKPSWQTTKPVTKIALKKLKVFPHTS